MGNWPLAGENKVFSATFACRTCFKVLFSDAFPRCVLRNFHQRTAYRHTTSASIKLFENSVTTPASPIQITSAQLSRIGPLLRWSQPNSTAPRVAQLSQLRPYVCS